MPTGGEWTSLKREATEFVQNGSATAPSLLRHYLKVRSTAASPVGGNGGTAVFGGHGGSGGGGGGAGSGGSWTAGVATAQNVGGFLSRVGDVGLAETLREAGLGDLVGRPAAEVTNALLDKLAGPGSTLDQAAARKALIELNDELLGEAQTFEQLEETLNEAINADGLIGILMTFFGHYLYECFCRDFYERLIKKVGSSQAAQSLKSIKECITSAVKAKLIGLNAAAFKWHGADGRQLSEQILSDVLEIFEVPA